MGLYIYQWQWYVRKSRRNAGLAHFCSFDVWQFVCHFIALVVRRTLIIAIKIMSVCPSVTLMTPD